MEKKSFLSVPIPEWGDLEYSLIDSWIQESCPLTLKQIRDAILLIMTNQGLPLDKIEKSVTKSPNVRKMVGSLVALFTFNDGT